MSGRGECRCAQCRARDEREFWKLVEPLRTGPRICGPDREGPPPGLVLRRVEAYSVRTEIVERDGWTYDPALDTWIREAT